MQLSSPPDTSSGQSLYQSPPQRLGLKGHTFISKKMQIALLLSDDHASDAIQAIRVVAPQLRMFVAGSVKLLADVQGLQNQAFELLRNVPLIVLDHDRQQLELDQVLQLVAMGFVLKKPKKKNLFIVVILANSNRPLPTKRLTRIIRKYKT